MRLPALPAPRSPALSRRRFLLRSAAAAAGVTLAGQAGAQPARRRVSPNERLNLGVVGVGGRGAENLKAVAGENIVALCDVDRDHLAAAAALHPGAALHADWRRLLERPDLDGVVVSTPDHTHAVIITAALAAGRHVYAEKPLTHTVSEARAILRHVGRRPELATQTGNQIHATEHYRRVVEIVQSGAIGEVREVHHWAGHVWETRPWPAAEPVPAGVDYDLWVGPAEWRDHSREWVPFHWRRWWHWGGGTLADFCCHHMDLGVWALQLGHPARIEAAGPAPDAHCAPPWLVVKYDFPARTVTTLDGRKDVALPPVRMTWYSGEKRPEFLVSRGWEQDWGGGTLFVGSRGQLLADYGRWRLFPEADFAGYQPPAPFVPRSPGHHAEWIRACKGGPAPSSSFAHGLRLTELGLLGNAAFRAGGALEWDGAAGRVTNRRDADAFLNHRYRPGWSLA
jgi:predicted dehydrogenase